MYYYYATGTAPVYFAAQEGRLDALRFLHTKAKCNMNATNADGWSPIHAASQGGHADVIEVRIMRLTYIRQCYIRKPGSTPLYMWQPIIHLCICSNTNYCTVHVLQ